MSVPGATIRTMPGDLERLSARVSLAGPGAGPAVLAGELLGRVRAEQPVVGELGEPEQVLVSAWLTGLRSARTHRAYAADVVAWLGWLAGRETGTLAAGRVHVDLWAATQLDAAAAASSVRRLSALSSFYRYCAAHDLIGRVPPTAWPGRWWIRTTPPPWAWTGTRPGPWSRPPTPTPGPRRGFFALATFPVLVWTRARLAAGQPGAGHVAGGHVLAEHQLDGYRRGAVTAPSTFRLPPSRSIADCATIRLS